MNLANIFKEIINIVFIIKDINLTFCDWRLTKNLVQAQENRYEGKYKVYPIFYKTCTKVSPSFVPGSSVLSLFLLVYISSHTFLKYFIF